MDLVKINFINDLSTKLKEKKNLSESSVKTYIRNLLKLNLDEPFKNFNFLKDVKVIERRLSSYKENTKRNYLISIVSVLSIFDKPAIKKLHDKYYDLMMAKSDQIKKEVKPNELTETQEKNWMSWDDVVKKYKELEEIVNGFVTKKGISDEQYNVLLSYIILSLYIHQSPRRNKDYQIMLIVNEYNNDLSKDYNYLDLSKRDFVFNSYKTSSKYGTQKIGINDDLWKVLMKYFSYHPLIKMYKKTPKVVEASYFLIHRDNSPLDKVNSITRILNKVFDKAIGSSMLRHIYLTGKYGEVVKNQAKDALDMAHSEAMQKDYIKKPKQIIVDF